MSDERKVIAFPPPVERGVVRLLTKQVNLLKTELAAMVTRAESAEEAVAVAQQIIAEGDARIAALSVEIHVLRARLVELEGGMDGNEAA